MKVKSACFGRDSWRDFLIFDAGATMEDKRDESGMPGVVNVNPPRAGQGSSPHVGN